MKRWELESAYARRGAELVEQRVVIAELRQLVVDQAADIKTLKEQVAELQRAGNRQAGRFRRDPDKLKKDPKKPGRKPGEGTWANRDEPTDAQKANAELKTSELNGCPCCGEAVTDVQTHTHWEWDIPQVQPVLTRFESESGYCSACQRRVRVRHTDQISEATGAAGVVIGPNAKALASDMKHHMGVSYGKISAFFAEAFAMRVERSSLYRADMRLAGRAAPVYAELIDAVRQLAQVHVDETGWRIGTLSAWLWVFCGRDVTVYTIRTSRGHEVVIDILGTEFKGILTTDGLITYDANALVDWLKQKCLAHILRRLKALSASEQAAHLALASGMTALLKDAIALGRQRGAVDGDSYNEAAAALEVRLDQLVAEHISDADDDGARMARHLTKHRDHLLRFLYHEGIDPTNNVGERDLRPGVITRKVGGCNRTDAGARAHAVLASISATCRKRRIPVIDFLVRLQRAADTVPKIASATPTPAAAGR